MNSEAIADKPEVTMDFTIKVEVESDSDSNDPLARTDSEQECRAPNTEAAKEYVWEVPITPIVAIKLESESGPDHDDEPEPGGRDIEPGGPAQSPEPKKQKPAANTASVQQTHQPREDRSTEPRDRRHQCKVCHKCFSGSGVLKKHLRQHTGEKPYACNICERRFTHNSSFQRHLVTHTGEKPYECSICQSRFTQESSLRTHLRTHTAEKPFECNLCHKHFARKYHLEEHSRTHTADKPYACDICQQRFTRKFSLKKHLRSCCVKPFLNLATEIFLRSTSVDNESL